mmetsp:Transcript_62176/g.147303  ORF Transcript_62176/g.147303 Transcript_62176/m.147303 type:complete len:190 (+) Transcript_62176:43-612(+)
MSLREHGGITYKYYRGTPQWEFGFGLSYTTFSFKAVTTQVNVTTSAMAEHFPVYYRTQGAMPSPALYEVEATNTGKVASDVVVLGFVSSDHPDAPANKELFGYERVHLAPGETTTVRLSIPAQVLSLVDDKGQERILPGTYNVEFGVEGAAEKTPAKAQLLVQGPPSDLFSLAQSRLQHAQAAEPSFLA